MKRLTAIVVVSLMLLVLFGCQSTEALATTTEVITPEPVETEAAPAPAPAPAPVPAEEEVAVVAEEEPVDVVSVSYEYLGYELGIEAADGKAVITYPDWVSESDVAAFFASEVEKYGSELDGILYMFTAPGTVEISYPAGVSADVRSTYIDSFVADLLAYVEGFDIQPATV